MLPTTSRLITGSKFGRSGAFTHRATAQQAQNQQLSRTHNLYTPLETINPAHTLPREAWLPLSGDGWFQATPPQSGTTSKCGLHSIIDGTAGLPFLCIYEPRTAEGIAACAGNSEFDLEVSAKIMRSQERPKTEAAAMPVRRPSLALDSAAASSFAVSSASKLCFQIVLAFKSCQDFLIVTCDLEHQSWVLSKVKHGEEHVCEQVTSSEGIKRNQFYELLIQVRGNAVSLDVNNTPIFTAVRIADEESLTGLVGVLARGGTKFAIKGWKIRGVAKSLSGGGGGLGGGAVSIRSSGTTFTLPVSVPVLVQQPETEVEDADIGYLAIKNRSLPPPLLPPPPPVATTEPTEVKSGGSKKAMSLADMMARRNSAPPENVANSTSNAIGAARAAQQRKSMAAINNVFAQLGGLPPRNLPIGGGGPGAPMAPVTAADAQQGQARDASSNGPGNADASADVTLGSATSVLYQSHDKGIVDTVIRDVVQRDLGISFDDIAALSGAKRLLSEAVILPLMIPEFFTGIREPWKGVLLFGPPGTGKTLLAKAVCSLNQSSFFNCPSSSLVSKYRGESEKIVRCLFEAARLMAPSVVFLDEVDALVGTRGEGEHEASRRLKTEIFTNMGRFCCLITTPTVPNCPLFSHPTSHRRHIIKKPFRRVCW